MESRSTAKIEVRERLGCLWIRKLCDGVVFRIHVARTEEHVGEEPRVLHVQLCHSSVDQCDPL
jgi:hypothetical protein